MAAPTDPIVEALSVVGSVNKLLTIPCNFAELVKSPCGTKPELVPANAELPANVGAVVTPERVHKAAV